MDDRTWDALEKLKDVNHESRRSLVRELCGSDEINANGFTLYQYHVVPAILGAQEALHPDAVSLHYAQIRAGLRWSYLDEEQSRFWERQTRSLIEGRVAPLCFETYSLYVLGDYTSLVPVPQESYPSETSTEGGVNSDDVAPSIPDVTESARNAVSPEFHIEPAFPPTPTPSLSDCNRFESTSPPSKLSTPSKENNTADMPEPSAESKIQDVLDRLQNLPEDNQERQDCYAELCTLLTIDGFTLFNRHAEAFARDGLPPDVAVYSWPDLWRDLPYQEKNQWKKRTGLVKKELQKLGIKQLKALYHFNTGQSHNKARKYRSWVHSSLTAWGGSQSPEETQSLEDTQNAAPLDPTSIIDVLTGRSTIDLHTEDVIARVLRGVALRFESDPRLKLQFRWRGYRIDYHPASAASNSLRERLRACVHRGLSVEEVGIACSDRQTAVHDLLKPLVYHNRTSPAFSDMDQVILTEGELSTCNAGHDSSMKWVEEILFKMRPFDPEQKASTVEAMMKHLRWITTASGSRARLEVPACSHKEFNARIRSYGLHRKLLHCFICEDLCDLAYYDLLEQTMHAFWEAEPVLAGKVNHNAKHWRKQRR